MRRANMRRKSFRRHGYICGCRRQCKETENSKGKRELVEGMHPFFFLFLKAPSFGLHSERFSAALSCTSICCICLKPWTPTPLSLYNFRVQMELHSYLVAKATLLCYAFSVNSSLIGVYAILNERLGYKLFKRCIIYTIHHLCIVNTLIQAETLLTSSQWAQKRYAKMHSPLSLACERFHRQAGELWNAPTLRLEFTVLSSSFEK